MTSVPMPQSNIGFSGAGGEKRKRWHQDIPFLELPDGEWVQLRFFGPVYQIAQSWLTTKKSRKKFPVLCSGFDPITLQYDYEKSPILKDFDPFNSEVAEIKALSPKRTGLGHVIARSLERTMDPTRPHMTSWRPMRIPVAVMYTLAELRGANVHNIEGNNYDADITDPYYGRDVNILYKSNAPNPTQRYNVQLLNHTPLTEVEQSYVADLYKWEDIVDYPSYEEVKLNLQQNGYYALLGQEYSVESTLPNVPQPPAATIAPAPIAPAATIAPAPIASAPIASAPKPIYSPAASYPPQPGLTAQAAPPPIPNAPPPPINAPIAQNNAPIAPIAQNNAPIAQTAPVTPEEDVEIPFSKGSAPLVRLVEQAQDTDTFLYRNKKVTPQQFQDVINKYAEGVDRAKPMITWDDLGGLEVLSCFSGFLGDQFCVKCPFWRYCLKA